MNITPEINAQLAETFAIPEPVEEVKSGTILDGPVSKQRLVIRFDPDTQTVYKEGSKRNVAGNVLKGATVTHFSKNEGARTPTGGLYTAIRFTVSYRGVKWVGQTKNGTDVVRLRRLPGMD